MDCVFPGVGYRGATVVKCSSHTIRTSLDNIPHPRAHSMTLISGYSYSGTGLGSRTVNRRAQHRRITDYRGVSHSPSRQALQTVQRGEGGTAIQSDGAVTTRALQTTSSIHPPQRRAGRAGGGKGVSYSRTHFLDRQP